MADKASGEKAGEKSFFARTAKNTTKRAKRAQEKVKRKLGKSDETKDEIFDRFVENFNKQQDAVQRLQKELKNYINCLKAMLNANQLFGEAVKQVYEPDWSGREKVIQLLDTLDHSWTNLVEQLQDEVLEPLTSYQIQFPETKNRIAKRSRKVVDYDRHRHHVETLKVKGGKTGEPKKLSQAEEDYNQAKNAYLQLHSDLYEELPALYDSRISFYVSSFQSIFTAEGVFHRETAKIKTEMNDLLDVLAKETSAGAYSTRRPLSVISNASSDGDSAPENCAKFGQTDGKAEKCDHTDENSENETSENEEVDAGAVVVKLVAEETVETCKTIQAPGNNETDEPPLDEPPLDEPPLDEPPVDEPPLEGPPLDEPPVDEPPLDEPPPDKPPVDEPPPDEPPLDKPPLDEPPPDEPRLDEPLLDKPPLDNTTTESGQSNNDIPPPRPPKPTVGKPPSPTPAEVVDTQATVEHEEKTESHDAVKDDAPEVKVEDSSEKDESEKIGSEKDENDKEKGVKEKDSENDLSPVVYKVEATHPYNGEDDDELTFEKGDIIRVVPYNESDDPDDGWLLGILEGSGVRGVFPENFTKKLEE